MKQIFLNYATYKLYVRDRCNKHIGLIVHNCLRFLSRRSQVKRLLDMYYFFHAFFPFSEIGLLVRKDDSRDCCSTLITKQKIRGFVKD